MEKRTLKIKMVIKKTSPGRSKESWSRETVSQCSIWFHIKEGENFPDGRDFPLDRILFVGRNRKNTLSILRIAWKLHCVPKFEPDAEIGPKEAL